MAYGKTKSEARKTRSQSTNSTRSSRHIQSSTQKLGEHVYPSSRYVSGWIPGSILGACFDLAWYWVGLWLGGKTAVGPERCREYIRQAIRQREHRRRTRQKEKVGGNTPPNISFLRLGPFFSPKGTLIRIARVLCTPYRDTGPATHLAYVNSRPKLVDLRPG